MPCLWRAAGVGELSKLREALMPAIDYFCPGVTESTGVRVKGADYGMPYRWVYLCASCYAKASGVEEPEPPKESEAQ